MRRRVARALLPGAAVLMLVACIPPRPSPSPSSAAPATPSPVPTAATASPAAGVVVDPALLDVLPDEVAGIPITPDLETAAEIAADGSIEPFVSAIALAAVFAPVVTDVPPSYVVVTVARLRPGTFSDLFFRGWRDTFDAAVCEQAGGVDGHAEARMGGRQTYIGTCSGGVHTYHVYLPARDVIVSSQGAGPGLLGEQLMTEIKE